MDRELTNLKRLACAEPPPALDRLVRGRMHAALDGARREGVYPGGAREERAARPDTPIALPLPERGLYAAGLVLYGAHAASMVVRLVWRSFVG